MFGLHDYARMISDGVRIQGYVQALRATVRPGAVVVDMGAGTGFFALVACQLGARRVYAIETNDAILVGRELARENGYLDRIDFIQEDVRRVALPEKAHVVVSDMHGAMPLAKANLEAARHAREQFLAADGVLIPVKETLLVAVVSHEALHARAIGPSELEGLTLEAMRSRLRNSVYRDRTRPVRAQHLLTRRAEWASLDFTKETPPSFHGSPTLRVERSGTAHGLLVWFESILADDHRLDSGPGGDSVYPQLFLPWTEPVAVTQGDMVEADLWALPEGEAWGWNATVLGGGDRTIARYKQSTLMSEPSKPWGNRHLVEECKP